MSAAAAHDSQSLGQQSLRGTQQPVALASRQPPLTAYGQDTLRESQRGTPTSTDKRHLPDMTQSPHSDVAGHDGAPASEAASPDCMPSAADHDVASKARAEELTDQIASLTKDMDDIVDCIGKRRFGGRSGTG